MTKTLLTLGVVGLVSLPALALADAWGLDPTFGTDGIVTTGLGGYGGIASDVALAPDGKIVVVGRAALGAWPNDLRRCAVLRYEHDGSLDTGFGPYGWGGVIHGLGPYGSDTSLGTVALQPDGKIVAAGAFDADMLVLRYLADGADLEPEFNNHLGYNRLDTGYIDWVSDVVVQADGRILAVGYVQETSNSNSADFGLVRLLPNGTLDPDFGDGGIVTTDFNGLFDAAEGVALHPDGGFVVVGRSMTDYDTALGDLALARYLPDGVLDPDFGTDGRVTTDLGAHDLSFAVAIQEDGSIVVGGQTTTLENLWEDSDFVVARYRPDGTLDPAFGSGGWTVSSLQGPDFVTKLALQADGKIVLAGWTAPTMGLPRDGALLRVNGDGSLDGGFGIGGWMTTDVDGDWEMLSSLAVQEDGRIVAVGLTSTGDPYDTTTEHTIRILVARYAGQDPADAIDDLMSGVESLVDQGALDPGQDRSLTVKLDVAIAMLDSGKDAVAVHLLWAFVHQLEDLVATGVLDSSDAQPLIDWARVVIGAIESP